MASLMKLGALPAAADPLQPTPTEVAATRERAAEFRHLFDTH
jgi:L-asparaginase